jgi:hypothetical protein
MRVEELADEARECQKWALEYLGRPEHPFLLKLAETFDELARLQSGPRPSNKRRARGYLQARSGSGLVMVPSQ